MLNLQKKLKKFNLIKKRKKSIKIKLFQEFLA
jgi:hypothetical protein